MEIQIWKYKYGNTNMKIQKWKFKNGNTNLKIQKWKYKSENTKMEIQIWKYKYGNTNNLNKASPPLLTGCFCRGLAQSFHFVSTLIFFPSWNDNDIIEISKLRPTEPSGDILKRLALAQKCGLGLKLLLACT